MTFSLLVSCSVSLAVSLGNFSGPSFGGSLPPLSGLNSVQEDSPAVESSKYCTADLAVAFATVADFVVTKGVHDEQDTPQTATRKHPESSVATAHDYRHSNGCSESKDHLDFIFVKAILSEL